MDVPGLIPTHDPYQSLRVRRFLVAALVYAVSVALMGIYWAVGLMPARGWALTALLFLAFNLGMYALLRTGRNERLPDPSLTAVQMFAACVLMAFATYQVEAARGGLLLILLVLLMFGAFRLRMGSFLALGLFGILCYAGVIALLLYTRPATVDLRVELLQLAALASVVPCGGFFVGYVGHLRRQLRARQVDLQRANEAVHELAVQDELTGVSNRRSIVRFLDEERVRADRLQLPLTVAIVDIDRFKVINRDYGHDVGDQILARVARVLDEGMRAVDGVGRYGGEEFLVVMPDTAGEGGRRTLERLRVALDACRLQDVAPGLKMTFSIGTAEYRNGERVWTLIERARQATDDALEAGGDAVFGPAEPAGGGD